MREKLKEKIKTETKKKHFFHIVLIKFEKY